MAQRISSPTRFLKGGLEDCTSRGDPHIEAKGRSATAYVYDPIYLEHNLPGHPEGRERLVRIMGLLKEKGLLKRLKPIEASPIPMEVLERVHSPDYIERVRLMAERGGGHLDLDTYMNASSYEAALKAAGGLVNLVKAILADEVNNGFALVRPPGHHAVRDRGMGFCIFNNVAVAARFALEEGIERILIADFDVHHGNGTQDAFYNDPHVLYFSTHQYPYYPGTGHWSEIGEGEGRGYNVNVPLSAGVGDKGYRRIFEELLYPLAERYRPQLILVSAGYDAHWADPLAGMKLSITGYAHLTRVLKAMAEDFCGGKIAFTLEGGYHLEVLAYSVLNTFRVLLGDEDVLDPLGPSPSPERSVNTLLAQLREFHSLD